MKRCIFSLFLVIVVAASARAQFLESFIFGAANSLVNNQIARNQETVRSAVKVVFDLYIEDKQGNLRYFNSWDPTTQTTVWFGDGVVLKVKPYSNRGPAHDHTVFANDRLVEWRKVEGGVVRKGKPSGAKGVIGDYPFVRLSDLDMGFNQIKVRVSKTEWGNATFIRLDVKAFLEMAQAEENRMKIAGAGGSTYPVLQSYVARMPDGTLRNFISLEEMQIALNGQASTPVDKGAESPPGPTPIPNYSGAVKEDLPISRSKTDGELFEVHAGLYERKPLIGKDKAESYAQLAQATLKQKALPVELDEPITVRSDQGLAVLVLSDNEFSAQLVGEGGEIIQSFKSIRTENNHSLFVPIYFANKQGSTKLVFRQNRSERTLQIRGEEMK